jgi:hypothetical protein
MNGSRDDPFGAKDCPLGKTSQDRAMRVFLLLMISLPTLWAQAPIWEAKLPGGTYVVGLTHIVSVSTQEYVVDGAIKVYELTIDTNGSTIGRFYTVEPLTPPTPGGVGQSALESGLNKTKDVLSSANNLSGNTTTSLTNTLVMKNYPTTTHAKTIEYRLKDRAAIEVLYKSVSSAWRFNRETSIKLE